MKGKRATAAAATIAATTIADEDQDGTLTRTKAFKGFSEFGIKWDQAVTNFRADTNEGVEFYGWWRRTKSRGSESAVYAIDIFAKRDMLLKGQKVEREFTIDSITYTVSDPRRNMKSLNADICSAMNKWFHYYLHDNAKRLDVIVRRAEHPTVKINRITQLDNLILKLKEFRQIAIACGGERLFEFHGDDEKGPVVHVVVNFTEQSIALESKPPPIGRGVISDNAAATEGRRSAPRAVVTALKMDDGNLQSMLSMLQLAKDRGDQKEQRRIRSMLRQMGHRGGARSVKE